MVTAAHIGSKSLSELGRQIRLSQHFRESVVEEQVAPTLAQTLIESESDTNPSAAGMLLVATTAMAMVAATANFDANRQRSGVLAKSICKAPRGDAAIALKQSCLYLLYFPLEKSLILNRYKSLAPDIW